MTKPAQTYRLDQEVHDWIRSEAEKVERGAGWFLDNLIKTKHMKATKAVAKVEKEGLNFSTWPYIPEQEILKAWLKSKKAAKGSVSQTAINTVGKELHKACKDGHSIEDCLRQAENSRWKGFKAEWMSSQKSNNGRNEQQQTTTLDRLTSRSWADSI